MATTEEKQPFMDLETLITNPMIRCRCYAVTGVDVANDTIKKIRYGTRSQTTPTGQLIMNTEKEIKAFFNNK